VSILIRYDKFLSTDASKTAAETRFQALAKRRNISWF
jgi:hypothetical protein